MGRKEDILEKVRQIAGPLAAQEGLELIDVEFGMPGAPMALVLYIDRISKDGEEGGVSLDDCATMSHAVSAALDVEDPIAGAYDLQVSSPGLDRPLRTPEHFQKYAGERVRVKTYAPISETDNRKTFIGKLNGYQKDDGGGFVLVDVDGKVFRVPHAQISKANVEPNFDN
ncbi:MAG TPA: ribosome maturation factor RimP [Myxococcales bacterium]|nr:ribosome maturation factor RimP [Myxococcales bacterium]